MANIDVAFCLINDEEKNINGKLPTQAIEYSTGYDVYNAGPELVFEPFEYKLIPLGFKTFIPPGWWLFLAPRSSTHAKKCMHTLYGVIDENYEGMWYFSAQYIPRLETGNYNSLTYTGAPLVISKGEAVAQIIVQPRYTMEIREITEDYYKEISEIRNGQRKAGGFGSTG